MTENLAKNRIIQIKLLAKSEKHDILSFMFY